MSKVVRIRKGTKLTHAVLASQLSEPQEELLERVQNESPLQESELRFLVEFGGLEVRDLEEWDQSGLDGADANDYDEDEEKEEEELCL